MENQSLFIHYLLVYIETQIFKFLYFSQWISINPLINKRFSVEYKDLSVLDSKKITLNADNLKT